MSDSAELSPPPARPLRAAVALGSLAVLGGLSTLAGWASDVPRLADWFAVGISMQPNTALSLVLVGAAVILLRWHRGLSAILAAAAGAIGFATLIEHLTGANFGIDTLLLHKPWGAAATVSPGRMGPPAATSLTLIGLGLILAGRHGPRARTAAAVLGVSVVVIALLPSLGYLFGARPSSCRTSSRCSCRSTVRRQEPRPGWASVWRW